MDALKRIFSRGPREEVGGPDEGAEAAPLGADEQAVTVWIRLFDPGFTTDREQMRLFALEDRVMTAVHAAGAGTYETNDLERGFFRMHLHGPDAARIVAAVQPVLEGLHPGCYLAVRPGPAGTSEERLDL